MKKYVWLNFKSFSELSFYRKLKALVLNFTASFRMLTTAQKMKFSLSRFSLVDVIKSAVSYGFDYIY